MKKSTLKKLIETIIRETDIPTIEPEFDAKGNKTCPYCGYPAGQGEDGMCDTCKWGRKDNDEAQRNSQGERECPGCGSASGESEDGYCNRCKWGPEDRIDPGETDVDENSGYSHGYIGPTLPQDPINEYSDSDTRKKAISSRPNDATKLIYAWVRQGTINFQEFEELAILWAEKTDQSTFGAS